MSRAYIVAGLGFGDEGKGTTVDYLCARDKIDLVVRYNGGAQAAHNVVTDDGRHHTFSQFGSGSFHGAQTYLSRFVFVDPLALLNEAEHLQIVSGKNPLELLFVDRECPVITPFHIVANLAREYARGKDRHGTCGMGVGETVEDWMAHPEQVPLVGDFQNPTKLREKIRFVQLLKEEQMRGNDIYKRASKDIYMNDLLARYIAFRGLVKIVDRNFLQQATAVHVGMVFEGAQGVLLDQDYGFQPHTTWSNTTFDNAHELLNEIGFDGYVTKIGVTRTYQTRHGQGPFPTEMPMPCSEEHNSSENEQGKFRKGALDITLLRYAIEVLGGIDQISLTHLDKAKHSLDVCTEYNAPEDTHDFYDARGPLLVNRPADYDHQLRLTEALKKLNQANLYMRRCIDSDFIELLGRKLKAPVTIGSYGPRAKDKKDLG